MKTHLLFFIALLFTPVLGWTQGKVSFETTADARQVVLGSYFEVSYTLSNANGTDFKAPRFDAFNVLSGPSRSVSTTSINGRWSKKMSYNYTLQPKQVGKFAIPPATIKVNGEVFKSNVIYIEVEKGKNINATTQDDLVKQLEEQIFIKAIPSTLEARIGEQVLMDYKVYTTKNVSSYNMVAESEYAGFYSQDIRLENPVIKEVVDGIQYSTKVLKRVALFPQQAGTLVVDSFIMEVGVSIDDRSQRRRSFFYEPLVTRFQIATDDVEIEVKSLPEGAPSTFSGAIGKYTMTSSVNRRQLTTDDALSIKMNISGNGDMRQVKPPALIVSDSFEVYEPKIIDEKNYERGGIIMGTKSIEYLLIPKYPGLYQIQPAFTYYNTDSLRYQTLRSSPFQVQVSKGKNFGKSIDLTTLDNPGLGEVRPVHTGGQVYQQRKRFVGSGVFWSLFALPFLMLGGVFVTKKIQASRGPVDLELLRRNQARKVATEKLSQAKTFLDQKNSRAFYDEISKGMFGYVGDKLNIPLSKMGKDNIDQQLQSLGVTEDTRHRFMSVLKNCEMALFAGKSNDEAMQETYSTALDVVVKVEEELKSS